MRMRGGDRLNRFYYNCFSLFFPNGSDEVAGTCQHRHKIINLAAETFAIRDCKNISVTNMFEEIWNSSIHHENHL